MSRKSLPTRSWPLPPSRTDLRACSSCSVNMSTKRANSGTLLKMSWVCSRDMGGGPPAADDAEESDELETVRDEELDAAGGAGTFWKGAGWPASRPFCQRWLVAVERQQIQKKIIARTQCQWNVDVAYEGEIRGIGPFGREQLEERMDSLGHGRCGGVIVVGLGEVGRGGRARLVVNGGAGQGQTEGRVCAGGGLGQWERIVLDDVPGIGEGVEEVVDGRQARVVVLERGRVESRWVDDGGSVGDNRHAGGVCWDGYRRWTFWTERRADWERWMLDHAASARRGIWTGHFSRSSGRTNGSPLARGGGGRGKRTVAVAPLADGVPTI